MENTWAQEEIYGPQSICGWLYSFVFKVEAQPRQEGQDTSPLQFPMEALWLLQLTLLLTFVLCAMNYALPFLTATAE